MFERRSYILVYRKKQLLRYHRYDLKAGRTENERNMRTETTWLALTHSNHFVNYRHKKYNESEVKRQNMDLHIEIVDLLLQNVDRFRAVNVKYSEHPNVTPAHLDAVNFEHRAESHVCHHLTRLFLEKPFKT